MIYRENVPIYNICWLNYCNGGTIKNFYEPENTNELIDICSSLYKRNIKFDLIGHTSNIYFTPNYNSQYMISTRKCNFFGEKKNTLECDCGASVRKISRLMVSKGIKGYEGLIDLPGTVGAAVYGNAGCYNCSINNLLISLKILLSDGSVREMTISDLNLSNRSSALKRGELNGVIISVILRKEQGDYESIETLAKQNHIKRLNTQPGPRNNLGSVYSSSRWSLLSYFPRVIVFIYSSILKFFIKDERELWLKKNRFLLQLLFSGDLEPYIYNWNRYMWLDEKSHKLFWKYVKIHSFLFSNSEFEIEIK